MNKTNLIIISLFFLMNSILFSAFEDVSKLEKVIFGFTYTNSKILDVIPTIETRMKNLEKKVLGDIGKGDISIRSKKLMNFLYNDTEITSIITRVKILEKKAFNQINNQKSLLTRIENIEVKIYGKYLRDNRSIIKRVENLENYFEIKEER